MCDRGARHKNETTTQETRHQYNVEWIIMSSRCLFRDEDVEGASYQPFHSNWASTFVHAKPARAPITVERWPWKIDLLGPHASLRPPPSQTSALLSESIFEPNSTS